MVYKHLRYGVLWRVLLLIVVIGLFFYLIFFEEKYVTTFITGLAIVGISYNLIHFTESTNRRLVRFFDSIRYEDLSVNFRGSEQLGTSFRELTSSFEEVLEIIRQVRAESQESLQYLQTVVQHVQVGLLAWDSEGRISIFNHSARHLLATKNAGQMDELMRQNPSLIQRIKAMEAGTSLLIPVSQEVCLAVSATSLKLRNQRYTLVSLHNILSELQSNEIEAWQNLTRVLRHEIMNSVAPISTLVSALRDMLEEEKERLADSENYEDFKEGLGTIENRTRALIRFVEAYRHYNNIPRPEFKEQPVKLLTDHVAQLMAEQFKQEGIAFSYELYAESTHLPVDAELLEMVLINLLKNALEAVQGQEGAAVSLVADVHEQQFRIRVQDNGPGISSELQEQVFIPFFTTKALGSGIGLALSRQIIRQHGGSLTLNSVPGDTVFTIRL